MEYICADYYSALNQSFLPFNEPFYKKPDQNYTTADYSNQQNNFTNKYTPNELHQLQQNNQNKLPMPKKMPIFHTVIGNTDDFPGQFNFQLSFSIHEYTRTSYLFSKKLSKLYIKMDHLLPLRFSWSYLQVGFLLRATMVYRDASNRSRTVQRCYTHMAPELPENHFLDPSRLKHVFRTPHPRARYLDNAGVLSILTPLDAPLPGFDHVPLDFQFYCKNSCVTGMNRRTTNMIFTLEDEAGCVVGKRSLQVQICSYPKRDKEKDEKVLESPMPRKRACKKPVAKPAPYPPPPPGPRQPTCTAADDDDNVYSLSLNVLGEENYRSVLKYAYDVMAARSIKTGDYETCRPYMDEVLHKMNE